VESTVLIVEAPNAANRNLELSARNIKGLELIPGNEVHPYHLLKYDRVIFSHPAIEKLQLTLQDTLPKSQRKHAKEKEEGAKKASASPRKRVRHEKSGGGGLGPNHYEIRIPDYSTSGHHRKRFGDQGKPEHAGLPGCAGGDEDGVKQAVQTISRSKCFPCARRCIPGKNGGGESLPATVRTGKGVCTAAGRREDAGVRAEFVGSNRHSAFSIQQRRV